MTTYLFTHRDCLFHDTGKEHPERPDRLRAVLHALDLDSHPDLIREDAPLAEEDHLRLVHTDRHIGHIKNLSPESGIVQVDPDTWMSPGSLNAALRAVGASITAVDRVMEKSDRKAFCAIRPPGHHAEPDQAMGFCIFSNAAIAAKYALDKYKLERVAIVDFDVHHGNGTQAAFEQDARLFYASSHQYPYYPGTGSESETGVGNIVNVPLPAGAGSDEFRAGMTDVLLPALRHFNPQLVIISAGFDAHYKDPLAAINLMGEDYYWITEKLIEIANSCANGRVVSVLEGGYDLDGLADGVVNHVNALMKA